MSAPDEELSPCRRFLLLRHCDTGADNERQRIQLVLAQSGACVLDLSDAGCRVELCNFDANGRALLHLRLSRRDGLIVMYPATLDLDNGFYYHGDPRQAHAPAGQAADLESIARGNGAPPEFDRGRAVRWPGAEQLASEALPKPETPKPESVVEAPIPEPEIDTQRSSDGRWRLESWEFEDGPEGFRGHARIVDTINQHTVFDLEGSNWYSRGEFNPSAYQMVLELQHADGRPRLIVFIDLDCLRYWEVDGIRNFTLNKMPASLHQLQHRLMEPSQRQKPSLRVVASSPAPPQRRSITSADGRFRVDLFPSGRSEPNARGEIKPYYHALFTDIEHGRIIADTRESKEEAWLLDPDGMTMELSTPAETQEWVAVDLRQGECWRKNFREPTSAAEPLQKLRMLLATPGKPGRAALIRAPMHPHTCTCLGDDSAAALEAIRKTKHVAMLVDESHFGVSIVRCVRCGQHFLSLFCERVDWADSDDPQSTVMVPISEIEVQRLQAQTANIAADENVILKIVANERRFLYHDMPKGAPETLAWKTRTLFIPGHD